METEMNVDPQRIRQLREARAWSQEHLASVSGLSTRTIQRLETSGAASPESRLALAGAFGVEVAALSPGPVASAPAAAVDSAPCRSSVRGHLLRYLLVCGTLLLVDLARHDSITWSKWPLLGWGLALLWRSIRRSSFFCRT